MEELFLFSYIALWSLVLLLLVAVFVLYRYVGEALMQSPEGVKHQGPELSSKPSTLSFTMPDGKPISLGSPSDRPNAVVFVTTGCPACEKITPVLRALAANCKMRIRTTIVCGGTEDGCIKYRTAFLDVADVLTDQQLRYRKRWRIATTPFAVFVDESGIVRHKANVTSARSLEAFYYAGDTREKENPLELVEKTITDRIAAKLSE